MTRGKTLWEMLLEKLHDPPHPVESQIYNPLNAKVGCFVLIDEPDWKDNKFVLKEVREYRRTIDAQQFHFADYELLDQPLSGQDVRLRLRLNPADNPNPATGVTHQVLVLSLYDDLAYNEELHKVLTDTTKRFQVIENDQVTEEFWRINDVAGPYKAQVTIAKDTDQDGKAEKDECQRLELEYWDYWRETDDDAGRASTQFLFVEMDTGSGWFQIWRGREISPRGVLIV